MHRKINRQASRFSPGTYFKVILFFCLCGIFVSVYLAVSHYRNFTDIGYQSFCAISRSLNCDTVSQSHYAVFLNVPVAVWGCLGYALFFAFLMVFRPKEDTFNGIAILCALAFIYSLISIALAAVSTFYIKSYCLMCIVSYGVTFILLLLTWMAQRRFGHGPFFKNLAKDFSFLKPHRSQASSIAAGFLVLSLIAVFFYPRYWLFPAFPQNPDVKHGVTDDGSPWIGAQNPELTIVEFTDYLCFQCGKMHNHLRRLVSEYPNKLRLVHRHFPLDARVNPLIKKSVHPRSGLVSLLSIISQEQGLFWEVNDALFRDAREKKAINFVSIAEETGLDLSNFEEMAGNEKLIAKLKKDIRAGVEMGIQATPTYVIDGNMYTGVIPENILSPALNRE